VVGKTLADVDDQQDLAAVDQGRHFLFGRERRHPAKRGGAGERRLQGARDRAAVFVVDGVGDVLQFKGRGVAEDDQLDERWSDQHRAAFRILEQCQEFLDDEGDDPGQGRGQHGHLSFIPAAFSTCAR